MRTAPCWPLSPHTRPASKTNSPEQADRFLAAVQNQAMAILSFALTTEELLAGQKTVTRRDWKDSHMANWQRWYDEGRRVHAAYDQIPIAGGTKIAEIRLTERPYWERLEEMPTSDLEAEGGMVDTVDAFCELVGLPPSAEVAVVRFEMVQTVGASDRSFD